MFILWFPSQLTLAFAWPGPFLSVGYGSVTCRCLGLVSPDHKNTDEQWRALYSYQPPVPTRLWGNLESSASQLTTGCVVVPTTWSKTVTQPWRCSMLQRAGRPGGCYYINSAQVHAIASKIKPSAWIRIGCNHRSSIPTGQSPLSSATLLYSPCPSHDLVGDILRYWLQHQMDSTPPRNNLLT